MKAKLCIISLAIGQLDYFKYTIPRMKKYAQRHQIDLHVIQEKTLPKDISLHWEKYQVGKYLSEYNHVLFLDADIWIQNLDKNIFEEHILYSETFLGHIHIQNNIIGNWIRHDFPQWDSIRNTKTKTGKKNYYNTGCFLVSSDLQYIFEDLKQYALQSKSKRFYDFGEQTALNHILCQYPIRLTTMDKKWNDYRRRPDSYFHHFVCDLKSHIKFPEFK